MPASLLREPSTLTSQGLDVMLTVFDVICGDTDDSSKLSRGFASGGDRSDAMEGSLDMLAGRVRCRKEC